MLSSKSYDEFTPDLTFRSTTSGYGMNSDTEDELDMDDSEMGGGVDVDAAYPRDLAQASSGNGVMRPKDDSNGYGSKMYRSNSRSLKPEAIAARGLKEWARLVLKGGSCAASVSNSPIILYESTSRQPSIIGRQVHPTGHDPAQFFALTEPRISRRHVLIWRELKDCNGDNMNPSNYCIKIQSLGTSGTSYYVRDPVKVKEEQDNKWSGARLKSAMKGGEGKPSRIPKDGVVTLEYDMMAEMGIVLGHRLFDFQLVLSPTAPILPRGPPPMRVEQLLDQLGDAMMM